MATTLEMRRGGPWWEPTLKEKPRLAKPPLTAWITASAVSPETVAALDSADQRARDEAYRDLAWEIRWPALLSTALALLAAFEFGRLFLGTNTALAGMMLCATTLLFTRFGRSATTDVQLLLWVAWSNVFLVHALIKGRRWLLVAAGGTLGLAFMSKGPVAFVQSLLPALAATWFLKDRVLVPARKWIMPVTVAVVAFVAIAFPWYVSLLFKEGHVDAAVAKRWMQEVTRKGATDLPSDPFYNYVSIVWTMAPWFVFFLCGLVAVYTELKQPWGRRLFAAGFFVGIPIVIMSCVKDKPERYLLPLGPAAALLAAHSLMTMYRDDAPARDRVIRRIGLSLPWLALVALGVASTRPEATQWMPVEMTFLAPYLAMFSVGFLAFFAIRASRISAWWTIAASAGAMMLVGTAGLYIYTHTQAGQTGYKMAADLIHTYYAGQPVFAPAKEKEPIPNDLNIYLNRVVKEIPVEEIGPADAVLVVIQKEKVGEPLVPAGWKMEHTLSAEKRVLAICVRDVGAATQGVTSRASSER